ncbi:MAG TPA: hypothetical protein VKR56_00705 [Candidatus Cybelea sp.]|nr:hypothetical protein [Candidatus Cybelea sp.]
MRTVDLDRHYVLIILTAMLAGCGVLPFDSTQGRLAQDDMQPASAAHTDRLYLYSADCCGALNSGGVKVYDPRPQQVVRRLIGGAQNPELVRLDGTGTLYVLNGSKAGPGGVAVSEFDQGGEKISRRVGHFYWARTFALDRTNRLYVANCNTCVDSGADPQAKVLDSVTVYGFHRTQLLRTITQGIHAPSSLAFDSSGSLYVSNGGVKGKNGSVTVYSPGSSRLRRTITRGIEHPGPLAIDRSDDLFVSDSAGHGMGANEIVEFAPHSDSILRTISDNVDGYLSLTLDGSGTLYVSSWPEEPSGAGWISVYAPGSIKPAYIITQKIDEPVSVALGGDGNLYVANDGGWTSVYAPGAKKPLRVVASGALGEPQSLAFGPR